MPTPMPIVPMPMQMPMQMPLPMPMPTHMHTQSAATLNALETLSIHTGSSYPIPVRKLRMGGEIAIAALREKPLFLEGGPWRQEVEFMGDLTRKNLNMSVVEVKRDPHAAMQPCTCSHVHAAMHMQPCACGHAHVHVHMRPMHMHM